MSDLPYFPRVAGSLEIVPLALVQLLKGITRGLGCFALPASTSLARPHSFKVTPESPIVFQQFGQEERKGKKKKEIK